jgi:hypothetical protein
MLFSTWISTLFWSSIACYRSWIARTISSNSIYSRSVLTRSARAKLKISFRRFSSLNERSVDTAGSLTVAIRSYSLVYLVLFERNTWVPLLQQRTMRSLSNSLWIGESHLFLEIVGGGVCCTHLLVDGYSSPLCSNITIGSVLITA